MSTTLSKSANQFGVELFQCYLSRHGDKYKNLLLCPYLIYHSLAMMLVGARGKTAEQLQKLLKIPTNGGNYGYKLSKNSSLSSSSSSSLAISTRNSRPPNSKRFNTVKCTRRQTSNRNPSPIRSSSSSCSGISRISSPIDNNRANRSPHGNKIYNSEGYEDARHREFLMLTEQLIHGNHEFVHLASFIYLDKETKRSERFKSILKDYYETKPKKIDFDNVDLFVKTVNEDVKRTTENIYNDILSKSEAQKMEKSYMLLVNAVFFRGFWSSNFTDVKKASFVKYSFPPEQTNNLKDTSNITTTTATTTTKVEQPNAATNPVTAPLPVAPQTTGNKTQDQSGKANAPPQQHSSPAPAASNNLKPTHYVVNMMSKLDYLPIIQDEQLDARIIKLPFEASDLQMLLILPNNKESDSTYLCKNISAIKINSIVQQFSKLKSRTVRVSMPIFCIDSGKISIQSTLITMGAGDLFDKTKADMSGVCENKQIWLHKILHRCFIICDNRGSITSSNFEKAKRRQAKIDSGISRGRKGVEDFVVNHPFMYIIMDSVTNAILIIGLYTDPSETIEIVHENQLSAEEAHQIYTEGVYKT